MCVSYSINDLKNEILELSLLLETCYLHLHYSLQENDTDYCRTKKRQVNEKIMLLESLLLDLLKE